MRHSCPARYPVAQRNGRTSHCLTPCGMLTRIHGSSVGSARAAARRPRRGPGVRGLDGERSDRDTVVYRSFLHRWPDRCAAAVAAVGRAGPGGVVVHCSKGCDRTGMVVMFILAICGISPEDIATDYELTIKRLRTSLARRLGRKDDPHAIQEVLQRNGCPSLRSAILDILTEVDVLARLRDGGLSNADVAAVRRRLIDP